MDDLSKSKEFQAAYLCVKSSVAEDISSSHELKLAIQYAGYNPTSEEVEKLWNKYESKLVSFSKFSEICHHFKPLTEEDVFEMFSSIFCLDKHAIKTQDFRNVLEKGFQRNHKEALEDLIEKSSINKEYISYTKISQILLNTSSQVKNVAMQKLDENLAQKRIDSRTFTKKHVKSKSYKESKEEFIGKDFEKWHSCQLKGCFFLEKDTIISHQYYFELLEEGNASIKISHSNYSSSNLKVDALAFLFKEMPEGTREYIGYTNKRKEDGSYYWCNTLMSGKYLIIPFTSGCVLRERESNIENSLPLILINEKKIELSSQFLAILDNVYSQFDLDGNSYLNRQEFNLYNWRTSGEIVQDDEWNVLEENFDVINGELTKKGFISLHQLEADDNAGDTEDMWLSLEAIGFNKSGIQDQAGPFSISAFCESSKPNFLVSGLRSGGFLLDKAVIYSIIEDGYCQSVGDNPEVVRYLLENSHRGSLVIQNKSQQNVKVHVDCSQSTNCITNRPSLDYTVEVDKKSAIVVHHFLCKDSQKPFKIISHESIL